MSAVLRRVLAVTIMVAVATGVVGATDIAPADAAPQDGDFVLDSFPIESPAVNFWDSWGARRSGGRRHQGVDIMSVRGLPVRAVAAGTLTEMGHQHLSGYFARIDHGDGWVTTYMHLNNDTLGTDDGNGGSWTAFFPTLVEGDHVEAGQIIGYVGDSGNAEGTRPHLHFEIRHDRKKLNPYTYLRSAWQRELRTPDPALLPML